MKIRLQILMLVLTTGWLIAGRAFATDASAVFESGNKFYEEKKFADAATTYESVIEAGSVSPALYFNLGNALFKSGQIGRAILAYRQAERLSPRDPDVLANLQFARNQVQGPTLRISRWEHWLGMLSLNEWTWMCACAIWLTFLLLAAMQLKPETKRTLRNYVWLSAMVAVIVSACLGCALAHRFTVETAVVTETDVTVRQGPLDESQSAFTAHDGAELRVLDRKDNWLQVTDNNRRIGWVKREQVSILGSS